MAYGSHEIFKQVKQLVEQEKRAPIGQRNGQYLIDAENILIEHLKQHPQDTESWLLLLCIEIKTPLDDSEKIIEYAKNFLEYHPLNAYALLFWSYADHYLKGNDDEELYRQLCEVQINDSEIVSMISIAKARYCEKRDLKSHEKYLLESIRYCDYYVTNYTMLGEFYIEHDRKEEGMFLVKQGLDNIQRLVTPENAGIGFDSLSVQTFLDEFFTGTTIIYLEYGRLLHLVN
jgi:ribosomal protein S15P/S13E